jgi:hypothetical protein
MLCSGMKNSISKKISSTLSYHTRDMAFDREKSQAPLIKTATKSILL